MRTFRRSLQPDRQRFKKLRQDTACSISQLQAHALHLEILRTTGTDLLHCRVIELCRLLAKARNAAFVGNLSRNLDDHTWPAFFSKLAIIAIS